MAIDRDDYEYIVVEGDSLRKIAQKHGLDPLAGARRIWEYTWKKRKYTDDVNMHGKTVHRKLHMGNNRYVDYDHTRWGDPGYRGYNDPHQIILYSDETVWIPPGEYEISDEELISGFVPDTSKRYKLKFPVFAVRLDLEDINEDDVFILTGTREHSDDIIFKKNLTIKDDKIEGDQYLDLHFIGTPKNLVYTLAVEPGPEDSSEQDENQRSSAKGEQEESQERYTVFEKMPYPKEKKKHSDEDEL